jgi:integrase/recombinase XerC
VLAGWAGLRAIEIARLRRENVLDTWAPAVLLIADGATKGHGERLVPLSVFVLGELRPILPARGWVFLRFDGRPGPNTPATISHLANQHLHDCGIAATLHQLRHRFATQAYQAAGGDLRLVQELLGHTTPATTAGYAAYDQAAAAVAVEAIPAPITRGLRACN